MDTPGTLVAASTRALLTLDSGEQRRMHHHFAMQLVVRLTDELYVLGDDDMPVESGALIGSQVPHQVMCEGQYLSLCINPTSELGWVMQHQYGGRVNTVDDAFVVALRRDTLAHIKGDMERGRYLSGIVRRMQQYDSRVNVQVQVDELVSRVLRYLEKRPRQLIIEAELARFCNISKSQLCSLVIRELGTDYATLHRYVRARHAVPALGGSSLSRVAERFAFEDGVQLNAAVRDTYGYDAKVLQGVGEMGRL